MKRFLLLMTLFALLLTACASAESAAGAALDGEAAFDFSVLKPDDPAATPIPVDPIDKPTPTPVPTPSYWYETYENSGMGVSFSIPGTWLLNPNTNQDSTVQFVEPKSEMMDVGGYQTRLTVEKVNTGLQQTASDAKDRLESTLAELESTFTTFVSYEPASVSIGDAKGYYCYYKAEYNDGVKNYQMRGRIAIVAQGKTLYQVRITTPQSWYSYYEHVWRKVRDSLKFN